jgi:death-on-curing protein
MNIFNTKDDPISPFKEHTLSLLDSALNLPKQTFGKKELYPTLTDKAAILYYTLNKNHSFKNGNKRIATASLLVFLYVNNHWLDAGKNEMVQKALDISQSDQAKHKETLDTIKTWIKQHLIKLKE